jgi:chorismate dehydratase
LKESLLKNKTLRIGRIPYANLFPTFYYLENECDLDGYRFIEGVPSTLNRMLREGKLDISPSSSIEYLKDKTRYRILPWFSISAAGPVGSILLFSRLPLQELRGKTIAVSSDSETSVALLKVICSEFFSLACKYRTMKLNRIGNPASCHATLLIGDEAMKEAKRLSAVNRKKASEQSFFVYDLGELWFKHTGLPFVFALWIVREKIILNKGDLIKKFSLDLLNAKKYTPENHSFIAQQAAQRKWLSPEELVAYWNSISYDFTEKHLEGLRMFEKYTIKNGLIP